MSVSDAPAAVEAELNYLVNTGKRPLAFAFEPPAGVPRYSGVPDPRRATIRNARLPEYAGELTLDVAGFQLVQHRSAVTDFTDEERLRAVYYREAEDLIREVTGAVKVVIFDHTLRDSTPDHGRAGVREPARRVHDDQTFNSGPRRVREHLPREEADARLERRFAIINFWRPIDHPVERAPLALCDARSIAPEDLLGADLVYPDKVGETYAFVYNPRHRWFYFRLQRPDEVLLLKIYDSLTDGTARLTAHTSFEDPSFGPEARHRRSIELRTLVFW